MSAKAYYVQSICDEAWTFFLSSLSRFHFWLDFFLCGVVGCCTREMKFIARIENGNKTKKLNSKTLPHARWCDADCWVIFAALLALDSKKKHVTNFSYYCFFSFYSLTVAHHVSQSIKNARDKRASAKKRISNCGSFTYGRSWEMVKMLSKRIFGESREKVVDNHHEGDEGSFLKWVKFQIPSRSLLSGCARWLNPLLSCCVRARCCLKKLRKKEEINSQQWINWFLARRRVEKVALATTNCRWIVFGRFTPSRIWSTVSSIQ